MRLDQLSADILLRVRANVWQLDWIALKITCKKLHELVVEGDKQLVDEKADKMPKGQRTAERKRVDNYF